MNRVSVFIPVYNEEDILEKSIARLIRYLENQNLVFEIIIGSNGSTDQTVALGQSVAARDKRISFFHLEKKGVGDAFKKGVLSARNDYVISQDMDLATDLGFIDHARALLDQGYDIVVGSKKLGEQRRSAFRIMGSGFFILCARILLGLPFRDYSIAAKAYKRSFLLNYLNQIDQGTSYVIDIICHAHHNGAKVTEVPVRCHAFRTSKFNIVHEGIYRFSNLFKLWVKMTFSNKGEK